MSVYVFHYSLYYYCCCMHVIRRIFIIILFYSIGYLRSTINLLNSRASLRTIKFYYYQQRSTYYVLLLLLYNIYFFWIATNNKVLFLHVVVGRDGHMSAARNGAKAIKRRCKRQACLNLLLNGPPEISLCSDRKRNYLAKKSEANN